MYPFSTLKVGFSIRALDVFTVSLTTWVLVRLIRTARRRARTTKLKGPPSKNLLFGYPEFFMSGGPELYESWASRYGAVYSIPSILGTSRIVLCDPKAISHFYGRESTTYILSPLAKFLTDVALGEGNLLSSNGEVHRRQRKSLAPAFSITAIRRVTNVFYDSAYKVKVAWDNIIQNSPDGAVIEVQNWMNHLSLDTIGIAGFSHDFGSIGGKQSAVTTVLDSFGETKPSAIFDILMILAQLFPAFLSMPSPRTNLLQMMNDSMGIIAADLLNTARKEREAGVTGDDGEKSIMGLLIKAEDANLGFRLTHEEVTAQMKVLLLAGYETTSTILTWILIELSKNQEIQVKLREELSQLQADPTWEQLNGGLPYLDAIVHEALRLHAPMIDTTRVATEDDIIPLGEPVSSPSPGSSAVTHIFIPRGTVVTVPIAFINCTTWLWGPDAKVFNPERWLAVGGIPDKAREIQGHRHLLTFIDGPRTCLGKVFAVTEIKAVLSVLIRNFVFELRDGPETEIQLQWGVLPRPKMAGEEGSRVPLRVKRVE